MQNTTTVNGVTVAYDANTNITTLTGSTYEIRSLLINHGCRWNKFSKVWQKQGDVVAALVAVIQPVKELEGEHLADRVIAQCKTQRNATGMIARELGVDHTEMRKYLEAMEKASLLEKRGTGNFRWYVLDATQTELDRFKARVKAPRSLAKVKVVGGADNNPELVAEIDRLKKEISEIESRVGCTTITIKHYAKDDRELDGDTVLPAYFQEVVDLISVNEPVFLVGPTGCGKSFIAKKAAEITEKPFGALSCSAGTNETQLLGRATPNLKSGKVEFQTTEFLRCYENGGVFLLDEIDAADSNLLLCLNAALANGYCNVPNRADEPRAIMHADFCLIATANTFGRGADRSYAGRNQLDDATLDRFRIGMIEVDYEATVEAKLCPDADLRAKLLNVREQISKAGLRRVLSSRFLEKAYKMKTACAWSDSKILDKFFSGWSSAERSKINV